VGADPEPNDCVAFSGSQCAPTDSKADGIDWQNLVDLFEVEAWVGGIFEPETIRIAGLTLDFPRQAFEEFPEAFSPS